MVETFGAKPNANLLSMCRQVFRAPCDHLQDEEKTVLLATFGCKISSGNPVCKLLLKSILLKDYNQVSTSKFKLNN